METNPTDQSAILLEGINSSPPETPSNQPEIHILHDHQDTPCNFWIFFYKTGACTPSELMKESTLSELSQKVESLGVNEVEPLLLVKTELPQIQKVYLYPTFDSHFKKDKSLWLENFTHKVKQFNIESVGIYLSELSNVMDTEQLIENIIISEAAQKIYLHNKSYSTNKLINSAVKIRMTLLKQNKNMTIFH